ncbi:MAG: N-acetylmuramoyl-L-alanine amidase [Bacteroidales bacterium]|nr:N-acetylmuramoyl-L-alanine amidase [Bacteroidales bacterium]
MKRSIRPVLAVLAALLAASIVPERAAGQDRLKLSTIVIDPGHGGHDPGCISADKKTQEKAIALDIAQRLSRKIGESLPGVKAVLTRSSDKFVTLSGRADIANDLGADLFISIHVNAQAKGTSANGYSIHCLGQSSREGNDLFSKNLDLIKRENSVILLEDDYKTRYQGFDPSDPQSYILFSLMQNAHLEHSLVFAEEVANAMKGGPISHNRGVSQDPFWVLWRTTMPAVLVEVGFITNANDLRALRSPEDRDRIAESLLKAVKAFKKRYDNSTAATTAPQRAAKPEAAPAAESKPEPAAEPEADPAPEKAVESSGVVYGVQVLATSKKMKPTDAFFKGYTPLEVRSGKLYKYILVAGDDLAAVRKTKKELDKKFPGCFLVSKDGETVTRIP